MSALPAPARAQPEPRLVTVTGTAKVAVAPDAAMVVAGVTTLGKTAKEALDGNSRSLAEVMKVLRESGVAETDIRTAGISLQAVMNYSTGADGSRTPRLTGYQVSNRVTVRVTALARLGDLLDRLVGAGANEISDVRFMVADESARKDTARADAVRDARRKAELFATAAGARIGRVHALREVAAEGGPQPMMMRTASPEETGVPIAPGQSILGVVVSVTFELEN